MNGKTDRLLIYCPKGRASSTLASSANFLEGTAQWWANRFEPGGYVMNVGRSIRLSSANFKEVSPMYEKAA